MEFSSPTLEETRQRLRVRFGTRVDPWWERLPELVADLAACWDLRLGDAVGRGNTSLAVHCAHRDGRAAILKLTPDPELCAAEGEALRQWTVSGRVPLVWGLDGLRGALLLEAIPGAALLSERRTDLDEVAELIGTLHHTGQPERARGAVSLAERVEFIFDHWIERHDRDPAMSRAVPPTRLERGRELARELAAHDSRVVLLHGDLHPGNVLDGGTERGLVAIDPRPCVGDAAFDAIDWVFWATDDPKRWRATCDDLADTLGTDRDRLWSWCTALAAMLAAVAARDGRSDHAEALLAVAP